MRRVSLFFATAALALPVAAAAQTAPRAATAQSQTLPKARFLSEADREFGMVDTNKDNVLSSAELEAARAKAASQIAAARTTGMFRTLDTDKNGSLSPAEFSRIIDPAKLKISAGPIMAFDVNKDGRVTQAEYRAGSVTRFDRMDSNKDGSLTEAELKAGVAGR